jgi:hypothetical protein
MSSSLISIRTADIKAIGDMVIMSVTLDDLEASLTERPAQQSGPPGASVTGTDSHDQKERTVQTGEAPR